MKIPIAALALFLASATTAIAAPAAPIYQTVGGVPANNLCDAGNTFKTLKPVKVCDQWQETPEVRRGEYEALSQWTCVASHLAEQTIGKEITVCRKFDTTEAGRGCLQEGKSVQSSKVLVWVKNTHMRDSFDYSDYTIPACR